MSQGDPQGTIFTCFMREDGMKISYRRRIYGGEKGLVLNPKDRFMSIRNIIFKRQNRMQFSVVSDPYNMRFVENINGASLVFEIRE